MSPALDTKQTSPPTSLHFLLFNNSGGMPMQPLKSMIFGPPNQEPRLEDLSLLLGHTYDPQTRMSGAHLRPSQLHLRPFNVTPTTLKPACQEATTTLFALWPNTKVLPKARRRKKGVTQNVPRSCFSVVWRSHCQSAECSYRFSFQLRLRASLPYSFVIDRSPIGA